MVKAAESVEQLRNVIPDKKDVTNHIFRDAPGHITDTSYKTLFEKVANNCANCLGPDAHRNEWYAKLLSDGRQVWVEVRDGLIWDAGINDKKRYFDYIRGLKGVR